MNKKKVEICFFFFGNLENSMREKTAVHMMLLFTISQFVDAVISQEYNNRNKYHHVQYE